MPYAAPRASDEPKYKHRADRAQGEQPVHDRDVDLSLFMAGGVEHPHPRKKAQLHRLLG